MPIKVTTRGSTEVKAMLTRHANKARASTKKVVVVRYGAAYAVYVHEDMQAHHPNGGQAKYLEVPTNQLAGKAGQMIAKLVRAGVPVEQAMLQAGQMIQAASQKLVPVLTGNLRASAETVLEIKV